MSAALVAEAPSALELRGINKRFGDVVALADAELVVRRGTVHAVLGENGAGKSTLMRIAFGLERADSGRILIDGATMHGGSVQESARAGVGMVHQHLSLVGNFTIAENLELGGHGRFSPAATRERLSRLSEESGLRVPFDAMVRDLSIVEQQRLEILKALSLGARVLILDEPTAVLAPTDVSELLAWIRAFVSSGGTVVLVTHKLREALAVADEVTVLRRGRVVLSAAAGATDETRLAASIFSDAAPTLSPPSTFSATSTTAAVFEAADVSVIDAGGVTRVHSANVIVRRGEILGVAAVDGSGHRELLQVMAALRRPDRGVVRGASRIAFIPADRARDAIIGEFTLTENVALHGLGARRGVMPWTSLMAHTAGLITRFGVVASSAKAQMRTLSGGNQQRVVVARELAHEVDLVVADNPTRGLDLKATTFVHEQLRRAARNGAGVVVHSSDLDEVLALATRVVVVFHGAVLDAPLDRDAIGKAMLGATAA
ncbi:MAG TPA: ATP-binding cassette domain-containing protein [Gemmatimonadaceae bacterium]|nr:ATP-binding cassette domain-containing protein [Gemmatimonadaceae bacterium]